MYLPYAIRFLEPLLTSSSRRKFLPFICYVRNEKIKRYITKTIIKRPPVTDLMLWNTFGNVTSFVYAKVIPHAVLIHCQINVSKHQKSCKCNPPLLDVAIWFWITLANTLYLLWIWLHGNGLINAVIIFACAYTERVGLVLLLLRSCCCFTFTNIFLYNKTFHPLHNWTMNIFKLWNGQCQKLDNQHDRFAIFKDSK